MLGRRLDFLTRLSLLREIMLEYWLDFERAVHASRSAPWFRRGWCASIWLRMTGCTL